MNEKPKNRTFVYRNPDGSEAFAKHKTPKGGTYISHHFEGSSCKEHPDGKRSGKARCLKQPAIASSLIYRQPEYEKALTSEYLTAKSTLYITEGESDSDAIWDSRLSKDPMLFAGDAVTTIGGASLRFTPEQLALLTRWPGVFCLTVDDNLAGWGAGIYRRVALVDVGVSGGRIQLRLPAEGRKDVREHLGHGDAVRDFRPVTAEELEALIEEATARKAGSQPKRRRPTSAPGPLPAGAEERLRLVEEAFEAAGRKRGSRNGEWTAYQCAHPRHPDRTPSCGLILNPDGRIGVNCFGCAPSNWWEWWTEVAEELGLDPAVLFPLEIAGGRIRLWERLLAYRAKTPACNNVQPLFMIRASSRSFPWRKSCESLACPNYRHGYLGDIVERLLLVAGEEPSFGAIPPVYLSAARKATKGWNRLVLKNPGGGALIASDRPKKGRGWALVSQPLEELLVEVVRSHPEARHWSGEWYVPKKEEQKDDPVIAGLPYYDSGDLESMTEGIFEPTIWGDYVSVVGDGAAALAAIRAKRGRARRVAAR